MKYSRLFTRPACILLTLIFVFLVSCQIEVPLKEIINAKNAIDSAKGVDAEKYSPEELKKSEELLLMSHDLLAEKKTDEAKKSANDSLAAAVEAEKKALPQYSDAHIKTAEEAYMTADKAYAEKFSSEKFTKAGQLKAEALQSHESGEFRKAAGLADAAFALAVEAKNESLQNSAAIEEQIKGLEVKYKNLKGNEYAATAEENLIKADTAIKGAKEGLANSDYKLTISDIKIAETELDAAKLNITKKGISVRIEKLRGDLDLVKQGDLTGDITADLDNALLALNAAESSLEQNFIEDAEMRVKEADALINGADSKLKEKKALAAIEKAEKLLLLAKEKDSAAKHSDNLDRAGNLISEGKTNVGNKKYNEGISNAEEAETIITAVLNSIESEINEAKLKASVEEHADEHKEEITVKTEEEPAVIEKPKGEIYVVQWRKKNTDCLWRISQKVYKDAAYWPAIYIANRDQIKDPDLIFPGQKFVIPPKPEKRPSYKKIMEEEKKALEKPKESTETK